MNAKKCFFVLIFSVFMCVCASASLDSDIQLGFLVSSQKEKYTESGTDFTNKTNRIGVDLSNFNFISDKCFGFFENIDCQFYRWGTSEGSGGYTYDYDDKRFIAVELLLGPAVRIKNSEQIETRIGAGFHYMMQGYKASDGYTFHDTDIGAGIIIDAKLFPYSRFSIVLGVKAVADFYNSKSYDKDEYNYSIDTNDYINIEVQPHIMFCVNIGS